LLEVDRIFREHETNTLMFDQQLAESVWFTMALYC